MERIETGPLQIGDDWPGVFIRGDNALHFGMVLDRAMVHLHSVDDPMMIPVLKGLVQTLMSCDARQDMPNLTKIERK